MKKMFGILALVLVGAAGAKTVALWPLASDPVTGEIYGQSVVNAADDLTKGDNVGARALSLGWNLPPNPDTSIAYPRFEPTIRGEVCAANAQSPNGIFHSLSVSTNLAYAIYPTHDFTVEGWVRFGTTPGGGEGKDAWWVIAYGNSGSETIGGWNFTLRRRNKGCLDWVHYQNGGVYDQRLGDAIDVYGASDYDAKEAAFTNRWMHLALTFRHDDPGASGKDIWTLYVDGVQQGCVTQTTFTGTSPGKQSFQLGGRSGQAANRACQTSFAYWRVSDACLATNEFLNAGGAGTLVPSVAASTTKHYWKLGRGANGGLDTRGSVGNIVLSGGCLGETVNLLSSSVPSAECAFTGNPPNPTVTLPDGNVGSVWQESASASLKAAGLGRELTLTNSFTVEGWVRPRRMHTAVPTGFYIFNTRESVNGWACQFYQRTAGAWYLEIYAQDSDGVIVAGSKILSGDLQNWHDWKHLALVYDVAGGDGKGEWRAYLDGTLAGTAVNVSKPAGDTHSVNFCLGGRYGSSNNFYGNLDCFRVCKTALQPNQFLNATNDAQAATDVLAFWPLNAQNGAYFDCADIVGSYDLVTKRAAQHLAAPSAEAPVVSNPDPTATFQGDPVRTDGSTGFRTIGGANSYLVTTRSEVRDVFTQSAFTIEGYVRRTEAVNDSWEILFGATANEPDIAQFKYISLTTAAMQFNFTYRTTGLVLYSPGIADVAFPNTADALRIGTWHHVALTYRYANQMATWTCYLDGESMGTQTSASAFSKPGAFLLGGRPHSANSFKGSISNVRISNAVLTPDQFLCATNATPAAESETLAYWPLDTTASGLDYASHVLPDYGFSGVHNVAGSEARAAAHPGLAESSATFQGDARANQGSLAFTDGELHATLLGDKLDLNGSFTVEGWLKWAHAVTNGLEALAGTYRWTYVPGGWRILFDTTGAVPRLRVFARGYAPVSVCVDDCFDVDVSCLENVWTHLALTYENRVGNGTWTLYLDGRKLGTVENAWSPNAGTFSHNLFKLGENGETGVKGFTGLVDMWRVTKGVRTPATFLYQPPRGMVIFVR